MSRFGRSKSTAPSCPENVSGHENGCTDNTCRCAHRHTSPIRGSTDVWCHDCQTRRT